MNRYLGFEKNKIILNSLIYGNFDYCTLVAHLCPKNSLNKIENMQKKGFKISFKRLWKRLQNFTEKSNKCTIEARTLRTLALETFKTLNDVNPVFMKNLFAKREVSKRRKNNLEIPNQNTVKYGDKRLGPHIRNILPEEIKNEHSYDKFKEYLNTWYEWKCTCSLYFLHLNKYINRN